MKGKKRLLAYLLASLLAVGIAAIGISFEMEAGVTGQAQRMQYFSNGFFLSAVLYLGCGLLTFIADAGNFYGIQYLGYTMLRFFSFRKERFEDRKDYFTYCTEKKAKLKEKGHVSSKWILLHVGLVCLALAAIFAVLCYRV